MRWFAVKTLLRKELLEVVRDRRSLFLMIFLPLLLYPLIALTTGGLAAKQMAHVQSETGKIAVSGDVAPLGLMKRISDHDTLSVVNTSTNVFERLNAGDVHAVIQFPANVSKILKGHGTIPITVHYDQTSEVSVRVEEDLRALLNEWSRSVVRTRLASRGLEHSVATPLKITAHNVAPPRQVGAFIMGRILPLLIVMMVVLGAFYPAIEVTAGEKERGTLQTLLTAPIAPLEIVTGKFLLVFCVAAVTGAANILAIALMFNMATMMPELADAPIDFGVSVWQFLGIGVVTIVIGLMLSALMMTVAVLARSFKEAQNYLTPVYLLSILPVLFVQLPGINLDGVLQIVPVINLALLLRAILESSVEFQQVFTVLVSSGIYTVGILIVAARIFEREAILLGEVGVTGLFAGERRVGGPATPSEALAVTAVVFILIFYIGSLVQAQHLISGLAVTQWLLILAPVCIFAYWRKLNPVEVFSFRLPTWKPTLAAILLGVSVWYAMGLAMKGLLPTDALLEDSQFKALQELLERVIGGSSLWLLLLVFAVSPAVCEEVLFRGFLLGSLRRQFSVKHSIMITALLFGAFHMSAIRFLPTAALGIVLALLVLRSHSLIPAMVFHALHNGLTVTAEKLQWHVPGVISEGDVDYVQLSACLVALLLGGFLLATSGSQHRNTME